MSWKDNLPRNNIYYETDNGILYNSDTLSFLNQFPDCSVDMVITSPPYWMLRDYGVDGQIGLEQSFHDYLDNLLAIFNEVKRILKDTGTCWVNLGDTFFSKTKCLIPERFAIEMVENGWLLRNTIIWHKPNAMPESTKDRFTNDYEYLYFFTKNQKYHFEQQLEEYKNPLNRWGGEKVIPKSQSEWDIATSQKTYRERNMRPNPKGRNKRCVWSINTKPFKGAHFAVFPEDLIEIPVKAGCPKNGVVLDLFTGSGTSLVVAEKQNRKWIGIEINSDYCEIAKKRLQAVNPKLPFF